MRLRRIDGFTLIEMLIIVAIVGLIAGLLLPVLSSVRKHAKRTECINNLNQIGVAIHLFADRRNEALPGTFAPDHRATYKIRTPTQEYVGLGYLVPNELGGIVTYVDDNGKERQRPGSNVFVCPSNNWTTQKRLYQQWEGSLPAEDTERDTDSTYLYRATSGGATLSLEDPIPCKALVMDFNLGADRENHDGAWVHVLFVDGHVKAVDNENMRDEPNNKPLLSLTDATSEECDRVFRNADDQK